MPFDSDSVTVRRRDDDRWTLEHALTYRGRRDTFIVPAGYVTDFASVPRPVVWLIPRFGRYTLAAILHDYLCEELARPLPRIEEVTGPTTVIGPRDVDGLFRRVMRELDVPPLRRWLMWCGVRWGALANPRRRAGWSADALPVLGLSLVALPIVVPAALLIVIGLAVYSVLEFVAECMAALS